MASPGWNGGGGSSPSISFMAAMQGLDGGSRMPGRGGGVNGQGDGEGLRRIGGDWIREAKRSEALGQARVDEPAEVIVGGRVRRGDRAARIEERRILVEEV